MLKIAAGTKHNRNIRNSERIDRAARRRTVNATLAVPEPAPSAILLLGFTGLAYLRYRAQRKSTIAVNG